MSAVGGGNGGFEQSTILSYKRGKHAVVTERNGDVYLKATVRMKNGKFTVKKRKIACGVRTVSGVVSKSYVTPEPIFEPKSLSAKKAAKKSAGRMKTSEPETIRERMHHEWDGNKPAYVSTTNKIPKILRQAKARGGSHVEQFTKDFELISSALRSINLEGTRGGSSLPIPLAQIQAQDRIKEFSTRHPQSYLVCKLIMIDSVDPSAIPIPDTLKKKGGVRRLIQSSVQDLANFYSPKRTRPDRDLIAFAKEVEEARRLAEISRA